MGLSDRIILWINLDKTVGIICQPCRTVVRQSAEAYSKRMTDKGHTYWKRQLERVWFPDCSTYLAEGSLVEHH